MDGLGDQAGNLDLADSSFRLSGTGRMTSYRGASSLDTSFKDHLLTVPIAVAFVFTSLLLYFVSLTPITCSYAGGGNKVPDLGQLILWGVSVWSGG